MSNALRRRLIIFIAVPAAVFAVAYFITIIPYLKYTRGIYQFLAFVLVADLAAALRGGWRNAATVVAALIFGLATTELVCAALEKDPSVETRGFSIARPVLGWGPSAPGVYHGTRNGRQGLIYDTYYTIDEHLLRKTLSAPAGPTVAFFGDSLTFGQGLRDWQTLPQDYADLNARRIRVLNFGFPGYGPQQFLRPLETGFFDSLLTNTKIFVYETAAWHTERAACLPGFMVRAPRYVLTDGNLTYVGACAEGLNRALRDIFMSGAAYNRLIQPIATAVGPADVELYIAELRRCAALVKTKFGGQLILLYMSESDKYLARSGFTDAMIKDRLRKAGVEVIEASLSPKDFPPGSLFKIPGDGHPTALANRARAALLQRFLTSSETSVSNVPAAR